MGTFYLTRCVEILCLFGFFRPSREIFTHMETTPLAVKGCKFRRMSIVWQCHYLFKQLRSALSGIGTPNLPLWKFVLASVLNNLKQCILHNNMKSSEMRKLGFENDIYVLEID